MKNIVKIYEVTCHKAYMASTELGTGFSLSPWGSDTPYYEGTDDGGKDYLLPVGFEIAETRYGQEMIFYGEVACELFKHSSGRPQLVGNSDIMVVLKLA